MVYENIFLSKDGNMIYQVNLSDVEISAMIVFNFLSTECMLFDMKIIRHIHLISYRWNIQFGYVIESVSSSINIINHVF